MTPTPGSTVRLWPDPGNVKRNGVDIYKDPTVVTADLQGLLSPSGTFAEYATGTVLEVRDVGATSFTKVLAGTSVGWLPSSMLQVL